MTTSGLEFRNDALLELEPVLKEWQDIVVEYLNFFGTEVCWWYQERSNVGLLASAAWRCKGWVALEEYSKTKRSAQKENISGRCDLYLGTNNLSVELEAKFVFQELGHGVWNPLNKVRDSNNQAWHDAGMLTAEEGIIRVAATFISPWFKPGQEADIADFIEQWLDQLKQLPDWHALAWVFPKKARKIIDEYGCFYPGFVLLLRQRQRAVKLMK